MSHIANVNLHVQDLDALEAVCARFNAELRRGQKTFRAYSVTPCDHAIRLKDKPQAYEIGLVANVGIGQGWTIAYDEYDGALEPVFGYGLEHLKMGYAEEIATRAQLLDGYQMGARTITPEGDVVIEYIQY